MSDCGETEHWGDTEGRKREMGEKRGEDEKKTRWNKNDGGEG